MCVIPGFPAALLDDPPQSQPPPAAAAATREQQQLSSSEDEQSPKVRKPYTITKQREKWSDEEHDKFLDAVKLYGRAWRRIEEHVGTKTAVQIRSHAQKFFSKVARESSTGDNSSSSTSPATAPAIIEIPPPRPKKRPLHPYPRKQGSPPKKRASAAAPAAVSVDVPPVLFQLTQGCIHHWEENGSPKSVLSAAVELNNAAAPSKGYGAGCRACPSSDSSITGPDEEMVRAGHENSEMDGASAMSNGGSESFDAMPREDDAHDKDPEQAPALVSFQLFGQTVVVSNPHKPASSSMEASSRPEETTDNSPPSSGLDSSETTTTTTDPQGPESPTPTTPTAVSCPCGVLPMLCAPLPPQPEQQLHLQQQQAAPQPCSDPSAATQPWWFFYGGAVALPFLRLPVVASQQHNECSGSDGDSSSGASADSVTRQDSSETPNKRTSVDRDGEQSGERSPRSAFSHQGTGFVPYKRQSAAQQPPSPRPCSRDSQYAHLS